MIVERTMDPRWLSNSWLVADRPGGHAVLVDTGGPSAPLLARIDELHLTVTHVLCTHHHHDHVTHNADYRTAHGCPVCGHRAEAALFGDLDVELEDGDELRSGDLTIRALHVPGHTLGQLAFLVNEQALFTGDTLFRGTVGGTRAPGHTTFEDLRHSILDVLLRFPRETRVLPGHTDETTVGAEWRDNPFVRMWRGIDAPGATPCTALGRPATLLLRARDYDGGTKCWVRFDAGGVLDVVPGSAVVDRA
ncbi:MAG: MBL fold metallo-hydrolase [Planctomycetes bacterium]|nr:MBL fold metallo-hydrolase [Planctomycetota bacterium]